MSEKAWQEIFAATARALALEIEKRLIHRGIRLQKGDIFHCSWAELISILRGDWDGRNLSRIVAKRKQDMEEYNTLSAPDNIIDGVPQIVREPQKEQSREFLSGLGVATGRASGIIMETGGFLSHGAIVAREYGIPAVVNVSSVLSILKDGDRVIVDGDEGKIFYNP